MIYKRILITGCGGDIGLTLGAIARETNVADQVIGCDVHGDHAGSAIFDACEILPNADHPDYLDALKHIVDKHRIDAIVPMSEAEIARLLEEGHLRSFHGRDVIAANEEAVAVGLDKLETNKMLVRSGLPAPWTCIVGRDAPRSFPCVLKPRRGQGGKGLLRVEEANAARVVAALHAGSLWQELILPDDAEYTCGLYRTLEGDIRTIIFRRQLRGGLTQMGEVVENAAIDALLHKIALAVDLKGAINVQLRVDAQAPKVFEINPRFSSTVGFRHALCFRDFIWSLQERRKMKAESYYPARPGTRIFRGTSVLVVRPQ